MEGAPGRHLGVLRAVWGVQSLTGSCKDDGGGHTAPLARPSGSRAGGVSVAVEEAGILELQSAVWGDRGSQGSRNGREQTG